MVNVNKREFLGYAGAVAAIGLLGREAHADPNGWPIGLHLYTVDGDLKKDFEGTLRKVAEIGYKDIETVGEYPPRKFAEFGKSIGLNLRSINSGVQQLQAGADRIFDEARALGVQHVVCSGPWVKDPSRIKPLDPSDPLVLKIGKEYAQALNILNNVSLDDWKWLTDLFNQFGEKARAAGLTFGYHNHYFEFKKFGEILPFDLLIEKTDPKYVSFEIDCGYMVNCGYDPVAYMVKHPARFSLLRVKDPSKGQPANNKDMQTTEIGNGAIDWKALFTAAKRTSITNYFVEVDVPFKRPPLESARMSYDYLHQLMT